MAMQRGLDLASEDPPLPGGPKDGVRSLHDDWIPPSPPVDADLVVAVDPRVITNHQPGQLPCPDNPPPPVGWVYWKGSVPDAVGKLAAQLEFSPAKYQMGTFAQALLGAQLVAARVEWHDFQGATGAQGCFRGTSLFRRLATRLEVDGRRGRALRCELLWRVKRRRRGGGGPAAAASARKSDEKSDHAALWA